MAAIKAKNGQVFVRKADGLVMGTGIDLGKKDTIKNYQERVCTDEEMQQYYPVKEGAKRVNRKHNGNEAGK